MSALTFRLRSAPQCAVDVSALIPPLLAKKTTAEIARIQIFAGKDAITAADLFEIGGSDAGDIRFLGDCSALDSIGAEMTSGRILVEGHAGANVGAGMSGGHIAVAGNAGDFAGAGLSGGDLRIEGSAGNYAGSARAGAAAGMRGGFLLVRGNAGNFAGSRMRLGTIVVEGNGGDYAGARMIAGTLAVFGKAGAMPGYLMQRGSIVLREEPKLGSTFIQAGLQDLVWLRLLARDLVRRGVPSARGLPSAATVYSGDMATLGKGEILTLLP